MDTVYLYIKKVQSMRIKLLWYISQETDPEEQCYIPLHPEYAQEERLRPEGLLFSNFIRDLFDMLGTVKILWAEMFRLATPANG